MQIRHKHCQHRAHSAQISRSQRPSKRCCSALTVKHARAGLVRATQEAVQANNLTAYVASSTSHPGILLLEQQFPSTQNSGGSVAESLPHQTTFDAETSDIASPSPGGIVACLPSVGEVVYGTVTRSNRFGACVRLFNFHADVPSHASDGSLYGWVHADQTPREFPMYRRTHTPDKQLNHSLTSQVSASEEDHELAQQNPQQERHQIQSHTGVLPLGTVRAFKVQAVSFGSPTQKSAYKLLLSASTFDEDVVMYRIAQVYEIAKEANLTLRARVLSVNGGGCACEVLGMWGEAFMPWSMVRRKPVLQVWNHSAAHHNYTLWDDKNSQELVGVELQVCIMAVDLQLKKVIVSERAALVLDLQRGRVVEGVVIYIQDDGPNRGVIVLLDGLKQEALLRIERLTYSEEPSSLFDVFKLHERVVGVVCVMERDETMKITRLQLATEDLEEQAGDMLQPKTRQKCMARGKLLMAEQ